MNYRMLDPEYFGTTKPRFAPPQTSIKPMTAWKSSKPRKPGGRSLGSPRAFQRGQKRSLIQSTTLLSRFLLYIDSWEFVDGRGFNHSIANMHVWLIYQRGFAENKYAIQLKEEHIESFNY